MDHDFKRLKCLRKLSIVIADVSHYIVCTLGSRRVLSPSPVSIGSPSFRIVCLLGTVGTAESLPTNARAVRPSRWVSVEWRPLSESVAVVLSSKSNINITNSSSAFSYI